MDRLSKMKWCLLGCLIVLLVFVAGSVFLPGALTDAVRGMASNGLTDRLTSFSAREDTRVEMVVERVGVSKIDLQPVVILREKDGDLLLPIWIGLLEADAISVMLEGVEVPRPLTADLLHSVLVRTGAKVDCIVVNDLKDNVFYATIVARADWRRMEIDARPSDSIALALRFKAPIYVERAVLDKAGIQPEQEKEKPTVMNLE